MKVIDVKKGMKVGFMYDKSNYVGFVQDLYETRDTRNDKLISYAIVETDERTIHIRVSRLLGLL